MKLKSIAFIVSISLTALLPVSVNAQQVTQELLIEALQKNVEVFEPLKLNKVGQETDFKVNLGKSVLTLDNGDKFDGFRFKVPEGANECDFLWYFNTPTKWAHWYLCPVEGAFEQSFSSWLDADKIYEDFDQPDALNRTRILQKLSAGHLKAGHEYIMWFRRMGDDDSPVTGRILFAKSNEKKDYQDIEKALKLKPQPISVQVKALNSNGGKILLDKEFFDAGYAKNRINSVFTSIRRTTRMRSGVFITMKMSVPPCHTFPSFSEIRKRHGEPDFIRAGEESNTVADHAGGSVDADSNMITYYYDYFGFVVKKDNPKQTVEQVVTHASNFANVNSGGEEPSYGQVSMENLTVLSKGGKEVGRFYYFLEGGKEPLSIKSPPKGRYKRGNEVLEFLGDGEWLWLTYHKDGSLARRVPMKNHRMEGKAEGFYVDGTPSFTAGYKDGQLDGKAVRYGEDGSISDESLFIEGRRQ